MKKNLSLSHPRHGLVIFAGLAASFTASIASADLTSFVNSSSTATDNQKQAGMAVQRTCAILAPTPRQQTLTGATQDLFLRCNEMVQSANGLQGTGATTRSLGYTSGSQLLSAVQQVSGEETSAQATLSTQVSSGQFANIGGRLNALRLGSANALAAGRVAALTPKESASNSPLLAATGDSSFAANSSSGGSGGLSANPWGWFTEGGYSFGKHDQTTSEDAFDFDAFSVTLGSDYNFGSAVAGASLGYDHYKADFDSNSLVSGGDVKVKGVSGSMFAAWFANGWNLNGIASFGKLSSDIARRVAYSQTSTSTCTNCGANRTLTGSPDGKYVAAGVTSGYDFSAGAWQFSPSLSVSYRKVDIDSYSEADSSNGGLALSYDNQKIESLRSILGFQVSVPVSKGFGVLTPSFKAEWHHEFKDDPRTIGARYALESTLQGFSPGTCISCFTFTSDGPDSNFGVAGVGLTALFAQRLQTYLYYEELLGASDLKSHAISLGLRGQF